MKHSTVLAAAMAMGLAFHAQAKTYTPVFTQSFDEDKAETFKTNFVSGTVASEIFGTSDSSESAISDEATHVQEQKSRYGATEDAKFYYYNRNEKSQGFSIIYKFPSSVTNLTDYKVEFDYYLSPLAGDDSRHSGLAIKGTQGIVATFDKQSGGGNGRRTDECILVYGDNNSQTNTFSTGGRGTDPSNSDWAPYWLHVTVYGNETDGLFLSVEQANGTVVLSAVRVGAFQPIEKLFFYGKFTKNYGTGYIKSFSLDNVVVCSGTADAFAWTGNEGDNKWATPGNWTVDGEATTKYPEIGDAVSGLDATALAAMDIAVKLETADGVTRFVNIADKSQKTWVAQGADTRWTTLANWVYTQGGFTVYEAPARGDTLTFPASLPDGTEVSFSADVGGDDSNNGYALVVDGNVAFVSTSSTQRSLHSVKSVSGSGVLSLDNVRLRTMLYKTLSISCSLSADGSADLYLRGQGAKVDMSGTLAGSGSLTLNADSNGDHSFTLTGDMSGFAGTLEIPQVIRNNAAGCSYSFNGDDSTIDLSGATVSIADPMTMTLGGTYDNNILKIGALTGAGTISNNTANAMTLQVGNDETDAESSAVLSVADGTGAWTVAKTGANTQSLTDATVACNVSVSGGTLKLPVGKALGTVAVSGGTLGFAADGEWVDDTQYTLFTYSIWESPSGAAIALDQSGLAAVHSVAYDFATAGTVSLTLSEAAFVWNGGTSGRWDDSANWLLAGAATAEVPRGGNVVAIDGATVLIDMAEDLSNVSLSNGAKLALPFDDSALSYTIPEGRLASDFVVAGPYTMAESEGVLTATRTASTFVWNGGASGEWTDAANWRVGGGYTAVVPGYDDTASFVSSADVAVQSAARAGIVSVAGALTLSGTSSLSTTNITATGDGILRVAGITVTSPTTKGIHTYINSPVEVVAGTTNIFTVGRQNDGYKYIYFNGNLSGSGVLRLDQQNTSGLASGRFSGDNSEFSGEIAVVNQTSRDITDFTGAASTSSNAVYTVYGRNDKKGNVFTTADTTYRLGALDGSVYQQSVNGYNPTGITLEIGNLNKDCAFGGDLGSNKTAIRKVGTAKLTCSAGNIGDVEIVSGTYEVTANTQSGNITFTGNGVFRSTPEASANVEIDYAKKLVGSTDFPIVFDDGDTNRTWASAIPASNTAGFTKMGSGTLTLEKVPLYTGLTTVKEGTLVVPEGSDITYNPLSAGTLTGVTPTKFAYPAGTTLTGAESSKTFDGTLNVSNVTAIDVSDATLTEGTPFVVAAATTVTGFTKDTIELTLPEGVNPNKWMVRVRSIDGKRCLCVVPSNSGMRLIFR